MIQLEIQTIMREILFFFWKANKGITRIYNKCTLHCENLSKNKYTLYKKMKVVEIRTRSVTATYFYKNPSFKIIFFLISCYSTCLS